MASDEKPRYRIELRNSAGLIDTIEGTYEDGLAFWLAHKLRSDWQQLHAGDSITIIDTEED